MCLQVTTPRSPALSIPDLGDMEEEVELVELEEEDSYAMDYDLGEEVEDNMSVGSFGGSSPEQMEGAGRDVRSSGDSVF